MSRSPESYTLTDPEELRGPSPPSSCNGTLSLLRPSILFTLNIVHPRLGLNRRAKVLWLGK